MENFIFCAKRSKKLISPNSESAVNGKLCYQQHSQEKTSSTQFSTRMIAWFLLKSGTRDFQNSPPFERSPFFYVTISGNIERSQYFNLETDFLENENLFEKTGVPLFS